MLLLTTQLHTLPKTSHLSHINGAENPADKTYTAAEKLHGPGFHFVRVFLLVILSLVGVLLVLIGYLSWHFSMDVVVEGQGTIEPRYRYLAKAKTAGIIRQVYVNQGQRVVKGQALVMLDDSDWKTELDKIEIDLEANQSQIGELEQHIKQEENIRRTEVLQASLRVKSARIQLERVIAEQTIYSTTFLLQRGFTRKPIEELLPVRMATASLRQNEANLQLAEQRLNGVETRRRELQALARLGKKFERDHQRLKNRLEQSTIRAHEPGKVITTELQNIVGNRVQAGDVILEIIKTNEWQALVSVKEIDLPKITTGQSVRLYIDAFPHMEYKIFTGTVTTVATRPTEISPIYGAMYSIKVLIQDPQVADEEHLYSLIYGMNTKASIVLERGRISELLWKRILRAIGKSTQHNFRAQKPNISSV